MLHTFKDLRIILKPYSVYIHWVHESFRLELSATDEELGVLQKVFERAFSDDFRKACLDNFIMGKIVPLVKHK